MAASGSTVAARGTLRAGTGSVSASVAGKAAGMAQMMSPAEWAHTLELARRDQLDDAQMAGLAIGCPAHGNAAMDWDADGVFCSRCVNVATVAADVLRLEAQPCDWNDAGDFCFTHGYDCDGK